MTYEEMIKKEKVEIGGRKFTISAIPCEPSHALWCDITKEMGDRFDIFTFCHLSPEIVNRILSYVAVNVESNWIVLDENELVNKYVEDESVLQQIVLAMCRKNFSFFFDGSLFQWLNLLEGTQSSM